MTGELQEKKWLLENFNRLCYGEIKMRRQLIDYKIWEMNCPVSKDSFEEFTKKEAEIYFHWYVGHIDERMEYLQQYILSKDTSVNFDFSVPSLIPVWAWYEKEIVVEHYTKRELKRQAKKYPKWIREEILSDDRKISLNTRAICLDMAIYFAEVFRRNNEDWVSWGFVTKPKSYISVNRPVLTGFNKGEHLDPTLLLQNCTLKAMDQKEKNMLYDLYHIWLKYQ